jgi:hypothetical protein
MKQLHCPGCGSEKLHRSRRRSRVEFALGLLGARMRRCHHCNLRLVDCGFGLVRVEALSRSTHTVYLAVAAVIAIVLVLGVIVWFGHIGLAVSANSSSALSY